MKKEDCWMTFSDALEEYLGARDEKLNSKPDTRAWKDACARMDVAKEHMDALTSDE